MPFRSGAANQPRSSMMFTKTDQSSWRDNAPNRGLVCGVLAMTALMSVTAVSALFIVPHLGQHSANSAQEVRRAETQPAAEPAKDKITTITAEPTGRQNRLASTSSSIIVSSAMAEEATDMPLAADPRWAQVVAASANKPLEAIPAIPGAEKVIAKDPIETDALALVEPDASATAAVQAIENETADAEMAPEAAPAAAKPAQQVQAGGQITIKRSVNMRSKPGGAVLEVIPAKASVEVVSCTKWCEIVFNGQRGFIYKSYVQ